jgi:hypothetical protein
MAGAAVLLCIVAAAAVYLFRPRVVFGEFMVGGSLDLPREGAGSAEWTKVVGSKRFLADLIARLQAAGDERLASGVRDGKAQLKVLEGDGRLRLEYSFLGYSITFFDFRTRTMHHTCEGNGDKTIDDLAQRAREKNAVFGESLRALIHER